MTSTYGKRDKVHWSSRVKLMKALIYDKQWIATKKVPRSKSLVEPPCATTRTSSYWISMITKSTPKVSCTILQYRQLWTLRFLWSQATRLTWRHAKDFSRKSSGISRAYSRVGSLFVWWWRPCLSYWYSWLDSSAQISIDNGLPMIHLYKMATVINQQAGNHWWFSSNSNVPITKDLGGLSIKQRCLWHYSNCTL